MRIGIGLGRDVDAKRAAVEAVRQAKKAVPKPDLALAFGGISLDQKQVHAGLTSEIDPAVLIGGSSYAEITTAGVTKETVAVLLLSLDGATVSFAGAAAGEESSGAGRALGKALPSAPVSDGRLPVALLMTSFGTGRENELLRSFSEAAGPVPVFGGMSCGDYDRGMNHPDFWRSHQYAGAELANKAARVALVDFPSREYRLGFGFEHGWAPVGPPVRLTRCRGNKVFEVGGMPVFDYYRQFLGRDQSDRFFELMVQRYAFSMLVGPSGERTVLKLPVACDFKQGCISFYPADDLEGREIQLIQASRRGLVEGARDAARRCREALGGMDPALVLVVSCCTRNTILHSKMDTEVDAIREMFGRKVPVFGYYSGGEIMPFLSSYQEIVDPARALSGSYYHTGTVGILAIAPRRPAAAVSLPPEAPPAARDDADEIARLKDLLAKSEEILDTTESFLANLNRKSYRDGEALKRQNDVIYRYTPHQVFDRIGESVARGEAELSDAEFNGCFLFMDVKGFTSYSEEHTSGEVVTALNELFRPATDVIYDCGGDVDKFIGDCIFASFKRPDDAVRAAKRILGLFSELKAKGNPFTVRIGINSGRAVRANVGAKDRREYTFIGDAVNLAQRLESNCTPGRMLLSEEVYRGAKDTFAEAERREVTVKGKKKPVVAYECAP